MEDMASFLSIPPEIRVQIYRELLHEGLEDSKQSIFYGMDHNWLRYVSPSISRQSFVYLPSQQHKNMSPILRTSSTIYREASKVFYDEASFRFHNHARRVGDLPTAGFPYESIHRIQHAELLIKLCRYGERRLAREGVQVCIGALRCLLERACSLKYLNLEFKASVDPAILGFNGLDEFWDLINNLGPKLERVSINLHHHWMRLPRQTHDNILRNWSPAIGWYMCSIEEREGFYYNESLKPYNKIPKWTFRRLRHQAPDGSR